MHMCTERIFVSLAIIACVKATAWAAEPGATVEVTSQATDISPEEYQHAYEQKIGHGGGSGRGVGSAASPCKGGGSSAGKNAEAVPVSIWNTPKECTHDCGRFSQFSSSSGDWSDSFRGAEFFNDVFFNNTDLEQSFCREVSTSVTATCNGSASISVICANLGVAVEANLRMSVPVRIPARSKCFFKAWTNLKSVIVELAEACNRCKRVLGTIYKPLTVGCGIYAEYNSFKM